MLSKNKATEGMTSSWQELLANNAGDMLKSSDEPAALLATLVQMMTPGETINRRDGGCSWQVLGGGGPNVRMHVNM